MSILSVNNDGRKMLQCQKSCFNAFSLKILFVICQNNILQFDSVLDCIFVLLVTRSRRRIEDGGDQEEDAGHEGREGQPDGQM